MRILISFVFILSFWVSHAQVVNPKIWYIGYQNPDKKDTSTPDIAPHIVQQGATILNLKKSPIGITRNGYTLSLGACNMQMYDRNDSLILYSNGSKIFNGKHRLVEGGDSLSFGKDWVTSPFAGNYYGEFIISVYANAMLALPKVANSNQYYIISVFISKDTAINYKLVYSLVDMSLNGGKGKVIQKEVIMKGGDFTPVVSACKHGNGRDWWIIAREYAKKNLSIFLLDSTGIKLKSDNQLSGWELTDRSLFAIHNVSLFNWEGSKYASLTPKGLEIFDFNRCTGILSNRKELIINTIDTFPNFSGGCFSPNDRFLYTTNVGYLHQVDMQSLKVRLIGRYDEYQDTPIGQTGGIPTDFGSMQLSYNGKIYISTANTTRYLHTIENPNDTGILCNFKQHSVKLLTFNNGLPHYPNYELGAVADKCGESGIKDNTVGEIEIYPNPASEYLEIRGQKLEGVSIEIYNLLGQKMPASIESTNRGYRMGVQALSRGIYLLHVSDKNHNLIKTERLVITR